MYIFENFVMAWDEEHRRIRSYLIFEDYQTAKKMFNHFLEKECPKKDWKYKIKEELDYLICHAITKQPDASGYRREEFIEIRHASPITKEKLEYALNNPKEPEPEFTVKWFNNNETGDEN